MTCAVNIRKAQYPLSASPSQVIQLSAFTYVSHPAAISFNMLISVFTLLSIIGISNAATLRRQEQQLKIVVGNDDGWATANIRALYKALNQAGYMVSRGYIHSNRKGSELTLHLALIIITVDSL
jgi:hypothetical protein